MKRKVLALVIPALLAAGAVHAAEIYNKDGNKLDLYGKVDGLHYFSSDSKKTAIKLICVSALKAKPRSTICLPAMVSGNITFRPTTPRAPAIRRGPVWHSRVSKWVITAPSTTVVTTACCTTSKAGPICCRSSAATPTPMRITLWQAAPTASRPTATAISLAWWRV